ncbi:MAG: gamma-butyrobetaine hydroxylase-like domain-containing protein, partial [Actinomycetota bacterium]
MNLETQARSVDLEADTLVVVWADEHVSQFELVELRRSCSCAQCRELRARGGTIWPQPG